MNRFARGLVAALLTAGLAFSGFSAGLGAAFGTGGAKTHGGATGCCRDFT